MDWNVLTDGVLKKDLEEKIGEINKILLDKKAIPENPGLLGGKAGIAIYFFYASQWSGDESLADRGLELIEEIFDQINEGFQDFRLSSGLAGVGWTVEMLNRAGFIQTDTDEILGEIDEYIGQTMVMEMSRGDFDYLHAATGNGLYLLYRAKHKTVVDFLQKYLEELEKTGVTEEDGSIKWESVINHEDGTKGFNLSLSHGMASIINFLGKMVEAEVAVEKSKELIDKIGKYIWKYRLDRKEFISHFPNYIRAGQPMTPSRLAWCYGDLGTAISLWHTARRIKNAKWESDALDILLDSTKRRTPQETMFSDCGICHGTAGVAHIYNRLYQYTKQDTFAEAARHFFNETLKMAVHKDGAAGYKAFRTEKYGGPIPEYGFLEGVSGMALTMISAVAPIEPLWDECLLLN